EVPAARLAARRRSEGANAALHASIPPRPGALGTRENFRYNRDFHSLVLQACGNPLLEIAAQPIFDVLGTHLSRSTLGRRYHRDVNGHHRAIAAAIEAGDGDAAGGEMHRHLEF